MSYANSCRRTLGRIGPAGEHGIVERLREQLGRSPDPHEIEKEMNKPKGSGRRPSQMPKQKPNGGKVQSYSKEYSKDDEEEYGVYVNDQNVAQNSPVSMQYDSDLIQSLLRRIETLEAKKHLSKGGGSFETERVSIYARNPPDRNSNDIQQCGKT
jgi:hypothetical protein